MGVTPSSLGFEVGEDDPGEDRGSPSETATTFGAVGGIPARPRVDRSR